MLIAEAQLTISHHCDCQEWG